MHCGICKTTFFQEPVNDLIAVNPDVLAQWNRPVPRYTSYPTAPQFAAIDEAVALEKLQAFGQKEKPLSIYIHIPFCKSMCLFCGCSVILNRKPEKQAAYFDLLLKEIALAAQAFGRKKTVSQLHLGGGTPTSLTEEQFALLLDALRQNFSFARDAEISIEIDPRTVFADQGKKLETLKCLGFNRVSFGVQDLDPAVQEAVKRRQSEEMTVSTYQHARALGFGGINIDLIYGLPLQTSSSFAKTAEKLIALKPDRIALFSYAKVPWLKEHQKAIREQDLPSDAEKFQIYAETRSSFMQNGYTAIGMDHFALENDSLAVAYRQGKLYRNFQGYSVEKAEDLLGLGVTSIGFIEGAFLQNVKSIEEYESRITQGKIPVFRGFVLQRQDQIRHFVIQQIMCRFSIDKVQFALLFGEPFDQFFAREQELLAQLAEEGLLEQCAEKLQATPLGRLFVRLIAACFDQYLQQGTFSRAI